MTAAGTRASVLVLGGIGFIGGRLGMALPVAGRRVTALGSWERRAGHRVILGDSMSESWRGIT